MRRRLRKAVQTTGELSRALTRVSNEYADAATWKGDCEFWVALVIEGLEREEGKRLADRIGEIEKVPSSHEENDELAAAKAFQLIVECQRVSGALAAVTLTLDTVRRALFDLDLHGKVTRVYAQAVSEERPQPLVVPPGHVRLGPDEIGPALYALNEIVSRDAFPTPELKEECEGLRARIVARQAR
jgi:hypothetical protein